MIGEIYRPKRHGNAVSEVWVLKADDDEQQLTYVIPPLGLPELIFFIGNRRQIKNLRIEYGFIKGQYATPEQIDLNREFHILGIRLRPYGLKQLFNISAKQLNDSVIDACEHELTLEIAGLLSGKTEIDVSIVQEIFRIIESYPKQPISTETIRFLNLLEGKNENNIAEIIKGKGIGLRSLQRKFADEVGLTPKKYLRIVRMNKIEQQLYKPGVWLDLISNFDFADQSHLIKEFRHLRQQSPTEMLRKKLTLAGQLPIPERIEI